MKPLHHKTDSDIFDVGFHDFADKVLAASAKRPILVDLWADWCSPCRVIAPILEQVVAEYQGAIAVAKVEVDEGENMKLAGHYRVRGFPTIILFQHGEERGRFSSARPHRLICEFIERHADLPPRD